MFIIDDILNWFFSKILDKYFGKYFGNKNQKIIDIYEKRLSELKGKISELEGEHKTSSKEKKRIIELIQKGNVSVEKLIEKYDKPLQAIIISYATQKIKNKKGYYESNSFLRSEFEKYNSKYLGGTDVLIPPAKIPSWIKTESDMKKWFEKDILKGRFCKIKFMVLIDLKKKTLWNSYVPYKQKKPMHFTIGEVLNIDDIFSEEQINKISLSQIIRDGDIVWLASTILAEKELDILLRFQKIIEANLNNPSLRELALPNMVPKIEKELKDFLTNPKEVAKSIVKEAKFWNEKMK